MREIDYSKANKANLSQNYRRLVVWAANMLDAAEATALSLGVSPEAIVAQAALETAWGKAAIGFNIFGIKADSSWTGKTQVATTREWVGSPAGGSYITIQDKFRDYASYADSMQDHFDFLKLNGRYENIFEGTITDEKYFQLLQQDGYATDPNYAKSLMDVLDSVRDLEQYIIVTA
jgi:flagellum-specific peptidoglycan hydrolase FlgJ